MPASPESSPPEPSRDTDAVLHDILRSSNQNLHHVAFSARVAVWAASFSAVGSLITAIVNVIRLSHGQ
jgi:hypothetical protein